MRVMVVGNGGREHALAWSIAKSPRLTQLFIAPGNAGTAVLGTNLAVSAEDLAGVADAAVRERIDLAVIGPEAPLAAGLADELRARDILVFGPVQAAAELESSKWFAKSVMEEAAVPHARGDAFQDAGAAHRFVDTFESNPPVVKADGLAAGKGVIVPDSMDEAHQAVDELLDGRFGAASETIVIEECLSGLEASAMAFVDGDVVRPMPLACDYKRIGDGDRGPNTGGMGVYSPPGFIAPSAAARLFERVHQPVTGAMQRLNRRYQGVLYAGLMVSADGAPSVLEFNCRFGDPETQVVLPLLETDALDVLEACAAGRLAEVEPRWSDRASVGVVLASGGYPGSYETGKPIEGLDDVDEDVLVFHAGTELREDGQIVTAGGRVLCVVASGRDLAEARDRAYANVHRIRFEGCQYRTDIALRELAEVTAEPPSAR